MSAVAISHASAVQPSPTPLGCSPEPPDVSLSGRATTRASGHPGWRCLVGGHAASPLTKADGSGADGPDRTRRGVPQDVLPPTNPSAAAGLGTSHDARIRPSPLAADLGPS